VEKYCEGNLKKTHKANENEIINIFIINKMPFALWVIDLINILYKYIFIRLEAWWSKYK